MEHIERRPEAKVTDQQEEFNIKRELKGLIWYICTGIALLLSFFHLYTGFFGNFTPMIQRGIHLFLVLLIAFFLYPSRRGAKFGWWDAVLIGVSLVLTFLMLPGFTPQSQLDRGCDGLN